MSIILSEIEEEILGLIQEYLNSNRIVEIDKLSSFLKNRLSRNKQPDYTPNLQGIKEIILRLIKKKIIIEGSRLIRNEILINLKRKVIYDYICKNPAVYHFQIMKELELPNHIVIWHLDVLSKFNFISTIEIENHQIYFKPPMDEKKVLELYYRNNKKVGQILDLIQNQSNGISKTQISKQLKMHPNTVKKYIDKMSKLNIIAKRKEKHNHVYYSD